ncbi:MAG: hypothetical protein AAF657_20830 [Acidobacteriota bacterium]
MNIRPSRSWLVLSLLLVSLLVQPLRLESQCNISTTSVSMFGSTFTVVKVLTSSTTCTRTLTNAASCDPTGPTSTANLFASAMTSTVATTMVACGWNCGCGQVTIDETDGLPVELMSFSIEGS